MNFIAIQTFSNETPGLTEVVNGVKYIEIIGSIEVNFYHNTEKKSGITGPWGGQTARFEMQGSESNVKSIWNKFHQAVRQSIENKSRFDYNAFFDQFIRCPHNYIETSYRDDLMYLCQDCEHSYFPTNK